jgi:hypothetical protein
LLRVNFYIEVKLVENEIHSGKKYGNQAVGLGTIFGSAIGSCFGLVTGNNIAITGSIGTALGIIAGSAISGYYKK